MNDEPTTDSTDDDATALRSRFAPHALRRAALALLVATSLLTATPTFTDTAEAASTYSVYGSCGSSYNYNNRSGYVLMQFNNPYYAIRDFRIITYDYNNPSSPWTPWSSWIYMGNRTRVTLDSETPSGARFSTYVQWRDWSGRTWGEWIVFNYTGGRRSYVCTDGT